MNLFSLKFVEENGDTFSGGLSKKKLSVDPFSQRT